MKRILIASLLALTTQTFTMEQPPQPVNNSRTFKEIPHDVERIIQMMALQDIPQMELKETLKNLANFTRVNKSFHAFVNNPKNMKLLLMAMARTVEDHDELTLAKGLKNMPGMKSTEVQEYINLREQQIPREYELAWNNRHETLDEYVAAGLDINAQCDGEGRTVLSEAISRNIDISYVQKLFALGANASIPSKSGKTPLIYAIEYGRPLEYIKEILKQKQNINHRDKNGLTALLHAVEGWYDAGASLIPQLINAGADVNSQDNNGTTPLILTVNSDHISATKILLAAGAKTDIRSTEYGTALDTARRRRYPQMEQLLLTHGAQ